ncbi:DUF839 domain-containing protein [Methylomonas sp. SURF-1]|uniref:DUF839 domain-containing protein n=1 Tax=Methylomonas aurea TaxID=2952224 RepID=A0ABT1UDZ6_9GAMM|nr:alkaline phosphatase PhoX [Methylomonas sp. SURF-1]MCQ8180457.1 DUF839 domain-containing protein [Methylomonas sp. SURF-1]
MKVFKLTLIAAAVASVVSPLAAQAASTDFDNFTALSSSVAAGSLPEAAPLQLANPNWTQRTLDANTGVRRGDNWDMNTQNETGAEKGRYIFTPYEVFPNPGQSPAAGVKRFDLWTNTSLEIVAPGRNNFVAGDASRWTPWGAYLTGEESWGAGSSYGRLFEVTNPTATTGDSTTNFLQRTVIPRTSHEGLAFDSNNNLYFIDEFNSGSIYKFTSANPFATNGNDFFIAGQTFALKVGAGNNASVAGAFTWEAITNASGSALAATASAVLNDGTLDGRVAADLVGATAYNRPEDLEIRTLADGSQQLFVATTGTHDVWTIDLATSSIKQFASRATINQATNAAVGTELTATDNLAMDAEGNIYIIEDQPAGSADIWFAKDADKDGVAESIGRWATMSTAGAEPTGLYFDINDPNVAYLNIQHTDSDIDRLIEIRTPAAVPVPGAVWLFGSALAAMVGLRRRSA